MFLTAFTSLSYSIWQSERLFLLLPPWSSFTPTQLEQIFDECWMEPHVNPLSLDDRNRTEAYHNRIGARKFALELDVRKGDHLALLLQYEKSVRDGLTASIESRLPSCIPLPGSEGDAVEISCIGSTLASFSFAQLADTSFRVEVSSSSSSCSLFLVGQDVLSRLLPRHEQRLHLMLRLGSRSPSPVAARFISLQGLWHLRQSLTL